MIDFRKEVNNIKEELVEIRWDLYEYLEIGFEEYRIFKVIKDFLSINGIFYIEVVKIGVCGIIKGIKEGKNKIIVLRGDIDVFFI